MTSGTSGFEMPMALRRTETVQRVQYHDGQLLAAADLRDDVGHQTRMRELHVRGLHGVWGIALGYDVVLTAEGSAFRVTQGLAYDCAGREIIMPATLTVDVPAAPRGNVAKSVFFDLLIRYDETIASDVNAGRECPGRNTSERPAVRWSYVGDGPALPGPNFADDVRLGEEIPLARVEIAKGAVKSIDRTVRRVARGIVRPHVAGGRIQQGSIGVQGSFWHWTAFIDTTAGGFNTPTPLYFVNLVDHPWLSQSSGFVEMANRLTPKQRAQLLGPFVSAVSPFRSGFTLDVRAAAARKSIVDKLGGQQGDLRLPVEVNWIGVERNAGCQPPMESFHHLYLALSTFLWTG